MPLLSTHPLRPQDSAFRPSSEYCRISVAPLKSTSRCDNGVPASFSQQQQVIASKLAYAVQQQPPEGQHASTAVATNVAKLVEEYMVMLRGSKDWLQMQQALDHAAQLYNTAAAASVRHSATRTHASASATSNTNSTPQQAVISAPPGGAVRNNRTSPWGFALRQPGRRTVAAAGSAANAAASGHALPPMQLLQQQQQQPEQEHQQQLTSKDQWCWSSVERLVVLGLGSIGQYTHTRLPQASSRLVFRFFQLVLATALYRHMLPGLAASPTVYDPEFDQFDQLLLTSLGFRVLQEEPSHSVSCRTLLYMPCCPRQLYSQVLKANWAPHQLQQIAILGTSMRSLADTQALFQSLTGHAPAGDDACNSKGSETGIAGDVIAAAATAAAGPSCQQAPGTHETDYTKLAYQQGHVLEVVAPDCAAHGVGVAVHLFKLGT